MAVRPRDLPMSISPLCSSLLPTLRLPQLRGKYKNIQGNINNTKGSNARNLAFKSKIWAWKTIFRRNSSLQIWKSQIRCNRARMRAKKIPSKLTCNSLTQASCKGSENSQHCSCPKMGVFLNSFLFAHFYLFFLFRYPLPWQENRPTRFTYCNRVHNCLLRLLSPNGSCDDII